MKKLAVKNGNSIAQAREVIEKEAKERETKCFAELCEVLQRHNCQFVFTLQIAGQKVPLAAVVSLPGEIGIEALK